MYCNHLSAKDAYLRDVFMKIVCAYTIQFGVSL